MVSKGPRFQEVRLMHWKQYILHMLGLSAKGGKAGDEKIER